MIVVETYVKENNDFKQTSTFVVETMEEAENIITDCDYYIIWNDSSVLLDSFSNS